MRWIPHLWPEILRPWRLGRGLRLALLVAATGILAGAAPPAERDEGDDSSLVGLFNEQLLLIATVVGAIAALPALIEFLVDRRKRKERIALSLDDLEVANLNPQIAGMDDLLESISDLLDRARNPRAYAGLTVGNEILIIGPRLSGKKTLAQRLAREARLDRLIIVYNPRNADALAKAKSLVLGYRRLKVMLLIPRIDSVFEKEDEELINQLEALIETTSERANVLVIGTALTLEPDSDLDNLFGIKLLLPGTPRWEHEARHLGEEARRVLAEVARFYLQKAVSAGFRLEGMTFEQFRERVLQVANNPAEIEDILAVSQTSAMHRRNSGAASDLSITPAILDRAIGRVIVSTMPNVTTG